MGKKIDLTGRRSGHLVAMRPALRQDDANHVLWFCICDCGGDKVVKAGYFRFIRSCGCLVKGPRLTAEQALERNVQRGPADGCWEWRGRRNHSGYGLIRVGDAKAVLVHRYAYETWVGSIPAGLYVCHHCDNPSCCNPAHLFLGTDLDNIRDMQQKNRHAQHERHGNARLTEEQVAAMRSAYTGRRGSLAALGREFGVTAGQVSAIVRGKAWKPARPRVELELTAIGD